MLCESLLGGVTTVADQHYFHPAGPDPPVRRGDDRRPRPTSASGCTRAGARSTLGPDPDVVQSIDEVVRHCAELIAAHHDPAPGATVRVALAPCGVHVDELALFDELAALAADHDAVRLHTHLYEKVDADAARERYGAHAVGAARRARLGAAAHLAGARRRPARRRDRRRWPTPASRSRT